MHAAAFRPSRRALFLRLLAASAAAASLSLLSACGGGDDDDRAPPPPPAPPQPLVLPELSISTAGAAPIISREDYLAGQFTFTGAASAPLHAGALDIRGRGNSTWAYPKKPYRLRLAEGAPLLGMPSSRHWVLLANYVDKTLLRNDVTFELSRRMGMEWTPRSRDVHVTLNGSYDGVYQLVENIRFAPDRVNLPALDEGDPPDQGGFMLEVDERRGEDFCFDSLRTPMVFCAVEPEDLNDAARQPQRDYIVERVRAVDEALFGPDFRDPQRGYAAVLDVETTITYFLLQELVKNVDGNLRLSTYLLKKPNDPKLYFGPFWDFDRAIGNINSGGADRTDGWRVRPTAWYTRLFEDPVFEARVKARWAALKADGTLDALFTYIDRRAIELQTAQVRNFERWPIMGVRLDVTRVVPGSYQGEVDVMKDWLRARIAWMDTQLAP